MHLQPASTPSPNQILSAFQEPPNNNIQSLPGSRESDNRRTKFGEVGPPGLVQAIEVGLRSQSLFVANCDKYSQRFLQSPAALARISTMEVQLITDERMQETAIIAAVVAQQVTKLFSETIHQHVTDLAHTGTAPLTNHAQDSGDPVAAMASSEEVPFFGFQHSECATAQRTQILGFPLRVLVLRHLIHHIKLTKRPPHILSRRNLNSSSIIPSVSPIPVASVKKSELLSLLTNGPGA
ncbi:hypothetical protein NP233_g2478 [Leucocoprinus birnbaumii]|uniref:Uncharacterized protein n=1 Tax=Leucocoprinus birnbaumii TaxID=56174 RepID=A0AAD5YYT4_9AGAR|nr:hypothetical protein NP233_g2478 [Leucocoprinus birnbaumii]